MSWEAVAGDVELHGGLEEGRGRSVAEAVVEEVGGTLLDPDRREMARVLPDWIGEVIARGQWRGELDDEGLFRRVAERFGIDEGRAVELTKLVCSVVDHRLDDEYVQVLKAHLPESIADLLIDRPHDLSPPMPERREPPVDGGEGRTLSTGRAGSHRPVSEGEPGHRESVARSSNPHADTKMSTSRGLTQEREHDSLATGREGSTHPVSEED